MTIQGIQKKVFLYLCDFLSLNDTLPSLTDIEIRFGAPLPAEIENAFIELKNKGFLQDSEINPFEYQIGKGSEPQRIKTERALLRFTLENPRPMMKHERQFKAIPGLEEKHLTA
jgi:hypothetical protein